jgi:hypothetical protein
MTHPETKARDPRVANYLQSMQALRSEMATAIECIAGNDLARLQESIATQEALCADLTSLANVLSASLPRMDVGLASQVRQTSASLRQSNLDFAAVLKHCGRSVGLLSSLCRTHTGQFQEARGSRSKFETWSCEM